MEPVEFLREIKKAGVLFVIGVPTEGGQTRFDLTPSRVMEFINDPVEVYASYYGVDKTDYLKCIDANYMVYCSARTTKGKRCKNHAKEGFSVTPRKWVQMQGKYCWLHGGDSGKIR